MSYNSLIVDARLRLWAPLQDDAASTTVEATPSNGVLEGGDTTATISVAGPTAWFPKSLRLNGTDNAIDFGDLASLEYANNDSYTWGAWLRPNGAAEVGYIFNKGNSNIGSGLYWQGDTNRLRNSAGNVPSNGADSDGVFVDDGAWVFVAASNDASGTPTTTFYRNGAVAGSDTFASGTTSPDTTSKFYIGRRGGSTSPAVYFAGDVAGAFVYDGALPLGDIADLYTGPEPIYSGSGVTLSQSGVVDVDESNWDDRGNGGLTFDVAVHVNDVETEVINDYAGGSVLEGLSLTSGDEVYVVVRALNNGDDDPAQNQTSNTIVWSTRRDALILPYTKPFAKSFAR